MAFLAKKTTLNQNQIKNILTLFDQYASIPLIVCLCYSLVDGIIKNYQRRYL